MKQSDKPLAREVLSGLLRATKTATVRKTFVRMAPDPRDGRIRTSSSPAGTETGRLNHRAIFLERSTNLGNLANKVAGLDPLYDARGVIVPEPGCVLVEADYSQIEARIAAWESGDALAIRQYQEGVDRYRFFAGHLFGAEPSEVSKPQRHVGKVGVLALQYGVSWRTLMEEVNGDAELTGASISAATAKRAIEVFHRLYPFYKVWWDRVLAEVSARGYLVNAFGRKRIFFARTDSKQAIEALRREAVAFIPQSTAADLLNWRAREIFRKYDPKLLRILLQIHDAILCSVDRRLEAAVVRVLKNEMEVEIECGGRPLKVPVEVSVAPERWSEKRKVG